MIGEPLPLFSKQPEALGIAFFLKDCLHPTDDVGVLVGNVVSFFRIGWEVIELRTGEVTGLDLRSPRDHGCSVGQLYVFPLRCADG